MNFYRICPDHDFLQAVADFILVKFANNLDSLTVMLPSGISCFRLQNILVQKQKFTILPQVYSFNNLDILTELQPIDLLEEKIIIAEIIYNYPNLNFSFDQALRSAKDLAQFFFHLECANIYEEDLIKHVNHFNLQDIQSLEYMDRFLPDIYYQFQNIILQKNKLTLAKYYKEQLSITVENLSKPNCYLIVAGVVGKDLPSWNFLSNVACNNKGYVLLPPISDDISHDIISDHNQPQRGIYYCLKKLLNTAQIQLKDVKYLTKINQKTSIFDSFLLKNYMSKNVILQEKVPLLNYQVFENIFEEADAIGNFCKQNIDKKIAIVICNLDKKDIYCNFLKKYSVNFDDFLGSKIKNHAYIQLIILLSEFVCNKFEIKNLFILLKHPLIYFDKIAQLEIICAKKNRFIQNFDELLATAKESSDSSLIELATNLKSLFAACAELNTLKVKRFKDILRIILNIARILCQSVNHNLDNMQHVLSCLKKVNNLNLDIEINKLYNFPYILSSLLENVSIRYSQLNIQTNIAIYDPSEIGLLKFDIVIIPDFNNKSWGREDNVNTWFNLNIDKSLLSHHKYIINSISEYNFYLLLHNPQIILTMAKKHDSMGRGLPSIYMLKLQFMFAQSHFQLNINNILHYKELINKESIQDKITAVSSNYFPDTISATDLEHLIRCPYSFYAKKILRLRKQTMICEEATVAEFGNILHQVLDVYNKKLNDNIFYEDKLYIFLDIVKQTLHNSHFPEHTKKIWQIKLSSIGEEFVNFDYQHRKFRRKIYTELPGKIAIHTKTQVVNIVAVADRIEVDDENNAILIDYKTGTLPNKRDILSALSPQLIIQAIIALEGGFGIRVDKVIKLMYVKIKSSTPYIKTLEIELDYQTLKEHKVKLQELLEYYVSKKNYTLELDLLKYNDYLHLSRV